MIRPFLFSSAISLLLVGGGVPTVAADDQYEGSLNRDAPRGASITKFNVPNDRPQEICVIPNHIAFARYREKDAGAEKQLSSYDFYKIGATEPDGAVDICPKAKSTSAAVEIYEVAAENPKNAPETANTCRQVSKSGHCLAKFKQTDNKFTTTSTAAILAYYHVSRILGDICEIKPAVLRTMDIEQHRKVVQRAAELGVHGTVAKSWNLFNGYYRNPEHSEVAKTLFTSDFKQIYGALLENTSGEESYSEWDKARGDLTRARAFQDMADSRSVQTLIGSKDFSAGNVQRLVAMRDMSEMILLDYLLNQSDRLSGGNISDYLFVYSLESGKVIGQKKKKNAPQSGIVVKKLTIKDTDAGLLSSNPHAFNRNGLPRIRHMHPDTYARLIDFAEKWQNDSTVRDFFHRECTLSNNQLAMLQRNLTTAANQLKALKSGGKLLLDLDLDTYFGSASR